MASRPQVGFVRVETDRNTKQNCQSLAAYVHSISFGTKLHNPKHHADAVSFSEHMRLCSFSFAAGRHLQFSAEDSFEYNPKAKVARVPTLSQLASQPRRDFMDDRV